MKCDKAKRILEQPEMSLSDSEKMEFDRHIADCASCAEYQEEIKSLESVLLLERSHIHSVPLSKSFDIRLSAALNEEANCSDCGFISRILNLIDSHLCSVASIPRSSRIALVSAGSLLAGLLILGSLSVTPAPRNIEPGFGRIAAFSTRTSSDGRVYASIAEHGTITSDPRTMRVAK